MVPLLVGADGCKVRGTATLNQDPNRRWSTTALADDAKILFRQPYAVGVGSDAKELNLSLAGGFDLSHESCSDLDAALIPNELGKAHNLLFAKDPPGDVTSAWFDIATKGDNMEVSLLNRDSSSQAALSVPAEVPVAVNAAFSATAVSLALAHVRHTLSLSDKARKCLTATLCKPTTGGFIPQSVRYADQVYYGNMVRVAFREQAFSLGASVKATEKVEASFETTSKNLRLDGVLLGQIGAGDKEKFDVPEMMNLLGEKRVGEIQAHIEKYAKNNQVVAIQFADVRCSP
jgi:hypothetical protein